MTVLFTLNGILKPSLWLITTLYNTHRMCMHQTLTRISMNKDATGNWNLKEKQRINVATQYANWWCILCVISSRNPLSKHENRLSNEIPRCAVLTAIVFTKWIFTENKTTTTKTNQFYRLRCAKWRMFNVNGEFHVMTYISCIQRRLNKWK